MQFGLGHLGDEGFEFHVGTDVSRLGEGALVNGA